MLVRIPAAFKGGYINLQKAASSHDIFHEGICLHIIGITIGKVNSFRLQRSIISELYFDTTDRIRQSFILCSFFSKKIPFMDECLFIYFCHRVPPSYTVPRFLRDALP